MGCLVTLLNQRSVWFFTVLTSYTASLTPCLVTRLRDYKKPSVKMKTYAAYEAQVKNHIIPELGNYTLSALRNDMVQRFVNGLSDKGLKSLTVERIVGILKAALVQAVDNGLIAKSPATRVKCLLRKNVHRVYLPFLNKKYL